MAHDANRKPTSEEKLDAELVSLTESTSLEHGALEKNTVSKSDFDELSNDYQKRVVTDLMKTKEQLEDLLADYEARVVDQVSIQELVETINICLTQTENNKLAIQEMATMLDAETGLSDDYLTTVNEILY